MGLKILDTRQSRTVIPQKQETKEMSPKTAGEKRASERKYKYIDPWKVHFKYPAEYRLVCMDGRKLPKVEEFPERIEQMVLGTHIGLGTGTLHNS